MPSLRGGSFRLFRLAGVDVFLHWSWFLIAAIEVQSRQGTYSSVVWNVLEYLALFLIVLTHEFGHAMACRSVGGRADRIVLWPLGGVAYVNPPQRAGAMLWSIAAGPLVNVALVPIFFGAMMLASSMGWPETMPNVYKLLDSVAWINGALLIFNLLPIYPLDGGQILRSVLWFMMGRARSLMVATVIGLLGAAALVAYAIYDQSVWTFAICAFIVMNCWSGLQQARKLLQFAKLPRREGFQCPSCKTGPPLGPYWGCGHCQQSFDTFATGGVCPNCGVQYATTTCLDCGEQRPISEWTVGADPRVAVVSSSFSG